MKALFTGLRRGSAVQVAILTAALAAGASSIGLAVRQDAEMHQAHTVAYQLCLHRERAEVRLRALERNDIDLQRTMIRIETADRIDARLRGQRIAAYTAKLVADTAYLATPAEDGCERLPR